MLTRFFLLTLVCSFSFCLLAQQPPIATAVLNSSLLKQNLSSRDTSLDAENSAQTIGGSLARQSADCYKCFNNCAGAPPKPSPTPANNSKTATLNQCTSPSSGITFTSCNQCAALGFYAVFTLNLSRQYHDLVPMVVEGANDVSSSDNNPSGYDSNYLMDSSPQTKNSVNALKAIPNVTLDFINVIFRGPGGVVLTSADFDLQGGFKNLTLSAAELADLGAKINQASQTGSPTSAPRPVSQTQSQNQSALSAPAGNSLPTNNPSAAMKTATVLYNGELIGCATCQSNFETVSIRLRKILEH